VSNPLVDRPAGNFAVEEVHMPLVNVKLIEGENLRQVTWVLVEEVQSGDWGIAGQPRPGSH
jgi:phenylpyruvate tautomerase PptA (4-oxalocrotonate tautomerase family)